MFIAIIITAVITALICAIVAIRRFALEKLDELKAKRAECERLRRRLDECIEIGLLARCRRAYQDGLTDGRRTDEAYRALLKKCRSEHYDEALADYLKSK